MNSDLSSSRSSPEPRLTYNPTLEPPSQRATAEKASTPTPYESFSFLQIVNKVVHLEQKCKSLEEKVVFLEQQSVKAVPDTMASTFILQTKPHGHHHATPSSSYNHAEISSENETWSLSLEEPMDTDSSCDTGEMGMKDFIRVVERCGGSH